jgi:hypothetical protein
MRMVSVKYKCPYPDAVWVRVHLWWITVPQMWRLLRKTNLSSRRRGDPRHINGIGTNKNLIMGPDGDRNQERLCWRRPAAICCYVMLFFESFMLPSVLLRITVRETEPSSRRRGGHISNVSGHGTNKKIVMGADGSQNQEWLCWRLPAAIYCSALYVSTFLRGIPSTDNEIDEYRSQNYVWAISHNLTLTVLRI